MRDRVIKRELKIGREQERDIDKIEKNRERRKREGIYCAREKIKEIERERG